MGAPAPRFSSSSGEEAPLCPGQPPWQSCTHPDGARQTDLTCSGTTVALCYSMIGVWGFRPSSNRSERVHMGRLRRELGDRLAERDLIFTNMDGSPLWPETVSHAWAKAVRRAGPPYNSFHAARHTHASLM